MDLKLATPLTLPNGLVLPNRLTKAAMAENLAKKGLPTPEMRKAYAAWATGGWGMVLTGNVQVDERHLGGPRDVVLLDDRADGEMLAAWRAWAAACKGDGEGEGEGEGDGKAGGGRRRRRRPVAVMQINHPGRQSPRGAGKRGLFAPAMAPSAVPLRLGSGLLARLVSALVFGTPREMTAADIEDVVRRFAETARVAAEAGFDGAEIHAAHGYLLAQFLSPRTNLRTDAYGANPAGRAKILVDVVRAMREATPEGFAIGIKFNSVDHQSESELRDCIEQLRAITEAGVDFLEVSGGTYEDPSMFQKSEETEEKSSRTKAREAFFLEFARAIRSSFPDLPLMVTGGFRTRAGMEAALGSGGCDLVGLGRPACVDPALPETVLFNKEVGDDEARLYVRKIQTPWILKQIAPGVGAGAESAWYAQRIADMAKL